MLLDVHEDGKAIFAFGAGLDFKLYMAPGKQVNPDGAFYEYVPTPAEGEEQPDAGLEKAGVPGKWSRLVDVVNGKKGGTPVEEVEDDGTVGDTAWILFGDQKVKLTKWQPEPLLTSD
jgi:hypothetical protein